MSIGELNMSIGELRKKWEESMAALIATISEESFLKGRKFERERIGAILKIGSSAAERIRASAAPDTDPPAKKERRAYRSKKRGEGKRQCVEHIRKAMESPDSILTTKEAVRIGNSIGVKSNPIIWSALRKLCEDGYIKRVRTGLYQRVQKTDPALTQPF